MKKLFIGSDVHQDIEAARVFADYASAQEADWMGFLGDLTLRPYTQASLNELLKTNKEDPQGSIQRFISHKRMWNGTFLGAFKEVLDESSVPYNVIPGNYDGNDELGAMFKSQNLHSRTATFEKDGPKLFGYGGADANPWHINLLYKIGEILPFEHDDLLLELNENKPDICMIHNPPKNHCDDLYDGRHVGTWASSLYIRQHSPKLVMSGHIHGAGPQTPDEKKGNPNGVSGVDVFDHPKTGKRTVIINPGNLGRFETHPEQWNLGITQKHRYGTFARVDIEDDGTPIRLFQYTIRPKGKEGLGNIGPVKELAQYNLQV
jgi:Icc-related predicted phosphoesterase